MAKRRECPSCRSVYSGDDKLLCPKDGTRLVEQVVRAVHLGTWHQRCFSAKAAWASSTLPTTTSSSARLPSSYSVESSSATSAPWPASSAKPGPRGFVVISDATATGNEPGNRTGQGGTRKAPQLQKASR